MNKYVITRATMKGQEYIISALYDKNRKMVEVLPEPVDQKSILGNIYIAKVENIVQNLNAAFVKISADQTCYLPLDDLLSPIFTKKTTAKKNIVAGDELLVQVSREALKTKEPAVTSNLNFTGKYVVLTTGNHKLSVSSKLSKDIRSHYKELLLKWRNENLNTFINAEHNYGVIIRTNATSVPDQEVIDELNNLLKNCHNIIETAQFKTCYSLLYEEPNSCFKHIIDLRQEELAEIVTDDRTLFEKICVHYHIESKDLMSKGSVSLPIDCVETKEGISIRFYQDNLLSLSALYSVLPSLEDALKTRIWLKSGAYVLIEHTEALTVIDVNTGKNVAKKDMQENFLIINKEAASEIARQLRLRNISGMILIDFMNLNDKESQAELLTWFKKELKKDPVPTQLLDITKLGLVEVTRKKVKKSLREIMM